MIILPDRTGWLANRIFLFCQFIIFSKEHDVRILNPGFNEYADFFQTTSRQSVSSFPFRKSVFGNSFFRKFFFKIIYFFSHSLIKTEKHLRKFRLFPGFVRIISLKAGMEFKLNTPENISLLKKSAFTILTGWEFRYEDIDIVFSHHDIIKNYFLPCRQYLDQVDLLYSKIHSENENAIIIGVHIRRGDYKTFESGHFFYEAEEYADCMKSAAGIFKVRNVVFLVCSNETIDPIVFKNHGLKFYFGTGDKIEDMYSLARCNYLMGPPSTYSMWASIYGKVPLYMIRKPGRAVRADDFSPPEKWMLPGSVDPLA